MSNIYEVLIPAVHFLITSRYVPVGPLLPLCTSHGDSQEQLGMDPFFKKKRKLAEFNMQL